MNAQRMRLARERRPGSDMTLLQKESRSLQGRVDVNSRRMRAETAAGALRRRGFRQDQNPSTLYRSCFTLSL